MADAGTSAGVEAGTTGAGASAGGAPSAAGAPVTPASGGAPPSSPFDWATAGVESTDMALVTERGWKGPKEVIESYRNIESLVGKMTGGKTKDAVVFLPDSGDAEGWGRFYDRLGRPKSPSEYKITLPEGDTGSLANVVSPMFHKAGLSQAQVQAFTTEWNAHVNAARKTQDATHKAEADKQMAELKTEWGAGYDTNALLVERAAKSFGMTTDQLLALKTVMGQKGAMKFMHTIGSKIAVEDAGLIGGETPPGFRGMSPATAVGEINRLKVDKAFSQMFNSKDPKVRMEAREKMDRLTKVAYPAG